MPIETIIAPVGKSNPSFDLQTDIVFGGNGGAKINKFLDCLKNIVIISIEIKYVLKYSYIEFKNIHIHIHGLIKVVMATSYSQNRRRKSLIVSK